MKWLIFSTYMYGFESCFKEVLMTKNGPIDFAQSWAIYIKNPIRFMAKRKRGVALLFLGP